MMKFPESRWTQLADELGQSFAPRSAEHDDTDAFVAENYETLKARKVLIAGVPEEFGGGGAGVADLAGMLRTLAHHCSSTALALSMHTHIVATAAFRWKNQQAPLEPLLKRIVAENLVLVSTGGADWLQGSGQAVKALMMTTAIYDDPAAGPTVLQIAVPIASQGVKVQNNWKALGMRGTGSHDITFEDVFVPDAAVALKRPSGQWHPLIHTVALVALPVFNAVYVGVAEAARDLALQAAQRRRDDPLTQVLAGELESELTMAQLALARLIDLTSTAKPGEATTAEVMSCRALLGRGARAAVDKAMELAGGGSFLRSSKLERLFRDVQGVRFHPMQDKPLAKTVGRAALGLPFDS
jgi:alkylation response protein AidB-like acyl-CoA dehydrogenase